MKKTFIALAFAITSVSLYAQEAPPQVPPIKQPIKIKTPTLPQQIEKPIKLPPKPQEFPFVLTSSTWNLIRWWISGSVGHSISDPAFKFLSGNNVSCHLSTPEAKTSVDAGTYSVHGDNVTIRLKKDPNVTIICNLVYNSTNKTLNGSYNLEVLPIANPPAGYTPGTVTGDMKLEIKP